MRVQLDNVSASYGASPVLVGVTLGVAPESRLGIVGPNGVGKTTLLQLLGGLREPDAGRVVRIPKTLTAGYLPQEPDAAAGETLGRYLARRTGVSAAETDLEASAAALATDAAAADRYAAALERLLVLGGPDLEPRSRTVCAELELAVGLDRPMVGLSAGSERALRSPRSCSRVSTCTFSTSRRTTSTSPGSHGSSGLRSTTAARWSLSPTTANSSIGS